MERKCTKCGSIKNISEFYHDKSGLDGYRRECKKCHNARDLARRHRIGKSKPMSENKECSRYFGEYIAERVLSKTFEHVVKMPHDNPGYDFICNKGHKIDVKSSVLHLYGGCTNSWSWVFKIKLNQIADYFLCLAFDDRSNLNPRHMWLIPANIVNNRKILCITNSPRSLCKWEQYEKSIDKVVFCCDSLRDNN
jgi:hypothetical protein